LFRLTTAIAIEAQRLCLCTPRGNNFLDLLIFRNSVLLSYEKPNSFAEVRFFIWLCHREWLMNENLFFLCFYEKNARKRCEGDFSLFFK